MGLEESRKALRDLFFDSNAEVVAEAMKIVGKYQDRSEQQIMEETNVGELQADGLKLTAYNFTIATMAANLQGLASKKSGERKYRYADEFVKIKQGAEATGRKATDSLVSSEAEVAVYELRQVELELARKAGVLVAASESIIHLVNMLKKVAEQKAQEWAASKVAV